MEGRARIEALMKTSTEPTTTMGADHKGDNDNEEAKRKRLMDAWLRLVDESPQGMGGLYKVMAIVPYLPASGGEEGGKQEMRALAGFGNI